MVKIYGYSGWSNCRKANSWLAEQGIEFESIQVRKQPPSVAELEQACTALGLKKLFNSSGVDYRNLGMKDLLPTLSEAEAIKMLSENGNLVKRPLVLTKDGAINGFKVDLWADFFAIDS